MDRYFDDLLIFAWTVEGKTEIDVIKIDPADNKYLACALEGEADFIVPGDHHLLDIKIFKGIKIVNARALGKIYGTCF